MKTNHDFDNQDYTAGYMAGWDDAGGGSDGVGSTVIEIVILVLFLFGLLYLLVTISS